MPAVQVLLIVLALVVFWAVVMRPARTQQKRVAELQSELEVGQRVVLSAGIFGTVRSLDGARVELEIAPGTVVTVARQVVVRRADDADTEVTETTVASEQTEPADVDDRPDGARPAPDED